MAGVLSSRYCGKPRPGGEGAAVTVREVEGYDGVGRPPLPAGDQNPTIINACFPSLKENYKKNEYFIS